MGAVHSSRPQSAVGGGSVAVAAGPHSAMWRRHIAEVLPNLWLGNREAACCLRLLQHIGVHACINCTQDPSLHPDHFRYLHVNVSDTPETDLLPGHLSRVLSWITPHLKTARETSAQGASRSQVCRVLSWITPHLKTGRTVLVYCQAGVSRSPTVVLGLLMHLTDMSLIDAWAHVKRIRPAIKPNAGFCQQLCDHERLLRGCNSAVVDRRRHACLIPSSQTPVSANSYAITNDC